MCLPESGAELAFLRYWSALLRSYPGYPRSSKYVHTSVSFRASTLQAESFRPYSADLARGYSAPLDASTSWKGLTQGRSLGPCCSDRIEVSRRS